ncbi:MAG: hypothetical protein M9961_15425 [Ilumatobacteraceae bacterium]|nr:hypothetical protein [Ilumatobacteraceae bacterium]
MSSPDLGALYRAARERISAIVTADGVDPDRIVPATPAWSVHDLVAHITGVAADATSGNMAGAPGEAWTAAQVERGRDRSIAEMVEEWGATGPGIEAFLSGPGGEMAGAAVMDIHTHEADVRHALGLPFEVPADFLAWAGPQMREGLAEQVSAAGLPAVEVDVDDVTLFRARLGRRTETEVRGYRWSADPDPYLDSFFIFGRAAHPLGEGV